MELIALNTNQSNGFNLTVKPPVKSETQQLSSGKPFIEANTQATQLQEIRDNHIIPVFIKDNEPLISHADFIDVTLAAVKEVYTSESIHNPNIRVSHPIKGRIPEAKNKPAVELLDHERTLYYERMAFVIEVPSINDNIGGNALSLTIGGVKSYTLDNLYSKKGSDEHFKVFVGFQNKVCTNLCVWSDGLISDLRVSSLGQLQGCIKSLIQNYNTGFHLSSLRKLNDYSITEAQFAQIIGRCRMYANLPASIRVDISPLHFGDNQIGAVVKDYYKDESFCKDSEGNINLWKLYNLLTGVNKSSYIDTFLEKSANAFHFCEQLRWSLDNKVTNWFLN
jgi:hypothetical protein